MSNSVVSSGSALPQAAGVTVMSVAASPPVVVSPVMMPTGPNRPPHPFYPHTTIPALLEEIAHPATPPERLALLAEQVHWPRIRRTLAAHPNTPLDALAKLIESTPDAFLTNPILPLLPLEQPGFYDRLSSRAARLLAARRNAPPPLLARLATSTDAAENDIARRHIANAGEADPKSEEWRDTLLRDLDAAPLIELPHSRQGHQPTDPAERKRALIQFVKMNQNAAPNQLKEMLDYGLFPRWLNERLQREDPDIAGLFDERYLTPVAAETDPVVAAASDPASSPAALWECVAEIERLRQEEMEERKAAMASGGSGRPVHRPPAMYPVDSRPDPSTPRAYVFNDRSMKIMAVLLENPATPATLIRRLIRGHISQPFPTMAARHPNIRPRDVSWLPLASREERDAIRERPWAKKERVRNALRDSLYRNAAMYASHVPEHGSMLASFIGLRDGYFPLVQSRHLLLYSPPLLRAALLLNPRISATLRRHHLEREGDRYVRAAGLARLAEPDRDFGI
jgi:hypothetical protein